VLHITSKKQTFIQSGLRVLDKRKLIGFLAVLQVEYLEESHFREQGKTTCENNYDIISPCYEILTFFTAMTHVVVFQVAMPCSDVVRYVNESVGQTKGKTLIRRS
jgi:hypothetical protein